MRKKLAYIMALLLMLLLAACNQTVTDEVQLEDDDSGIPVEIIPEFPQDVVSRAGAVSFTPITEFYVSAISGSISKGKNVRYYLENDEWKNSGMITWPTGTKTISFWGLSQKFLDGDGVSDVVLKKSTQSFRFTIDPENPRDISYASRLNVTYDQVGGQVVLSFQHALAYPYFTCAQGLDDVLVEIKEVKFHNLDLSGVFTYSPTFNSSGSWVLDKQNYGTFTQTFDEPIVLTNDGKAIPLTDAWQLLPQKPTKWATTATNPVTIEQADALHQCYVELKCKIVKEGGVYAWGHPKGMGEEYESVYIPFGTTFNTKAYRKAIKLNFTGGYLADGTPFVGRTDVVFAPWVTNDILIDPWEEMPEEDLNFN